MALTAVSRLARRCCIQPREVGALSVGSDSLLDRSKSIKTELMSRLESGGADAEGVDHCGLQCDSGNSALFACFGWAQGETWDGRWALAVCTDSCNLGAAAVLALVGREAPEAAAHDLAIPFESHQLGTRALPRLRGCDAASAWCSLVGVAGSQGQYIDYSVCINSSACGEAPARRGAYTLGEA